MGRRKSLSMQKMIQYFTYMMLSMSQLQTRIHFVIAAKRNTNHIKKPSIVNSVHLHTAKIVDTKHENSLEVKNY